MKEFKALNDDNWKQFIMNEVSYILSNECYGGICIDAGCNIGDFPMNHRNRFDKYVCFDIYDDNIQKCIENTINIGVPVEVKKLAVWSESNKKIDVFAYKMHDKEDLNVFGNSGSIGCIEYNGPHGEGWHKENKIGEVYTISIEDICKQYGKINLLKIDVEGSEYEFLMNKDLSKINYIVGEFHFSSEKIEALINWIRNTHHQIRGGFKLK